MTTDFYIRLNSEAETSTALAAFCHQDTQTTVDDETGQETVTNIGEPYLVTATHDYAIDIVGVIYKPTGNMLVDDEGNEYPETAPLAGWHVNIRLLNDTMLEAAEAVAAEYGVTPENPARVWA
jgi:hypothetical protein